MLRQMTRALSARIQGDDGSAVVEFASAGTLLLLPTVYFAVLMGRIEAASFAVDAAAMSSARAVVRADSAQQGEDKARAVTQLAFLDHHLPQDPASALKIDCPDGCQTPGAVISVTVAIDLDLPGVPRFIGDAIPITVPISATHQAAVDTYRESP